MSLWTTWVKDLPEPGRGPTGAKIYLSTENLEKTLGVSPGLNPHHLIVRSFLSQVIMTGPLFLPLSFL